MMKKQQRDEVLSLRITGMTAFDLVWEPSENAMLCVIAERGPVSRRTIIRLEREHNVQLMNFLAERLAGRKLLDDDGHGNTKPAKGGEGDTSMPYEVVKRIKGRAEKLLEGAPTPKEVLQLHIDLCHEVMTIAYFVQELQRGLFLATGVPVPPGASGSGKGGAST